MYYLRDSFGNTVRSIHWSGENLTFVLRHDTNRVESCDDLSFFDEQDVPYTVLDSVSKNVFKDAEFYSIQNLNGKLQVAKEADQLLPSLNLPKDDVDKLRDLFKKTAMVSGVTIAAILISNLFSIPEKEKKEELQVVQVLNRAQVEKIFAIPPKERVVKAAARKMFKSPILSASSKKVSAPRGVLAALGALKSAQQRGGLNLNQASISAGIGRGGAQGSGGVQTSVYAKGMTAAPLGVGGKGNGGGGYGTKGKGGGQAGYGQISLAGSGKSYFQPMDSEAWIEGGLDRSEISAVIQRHLSEVRYCYEQSLQSKSNLAGRVSIKFLIGAQGQVTSAQIADSSIGHAPVEACIRDRLKSWNFPQPQGGVTVKVTYPFILRRIGDS